MFSNLCGDLRGLGGVSLKGGESICLRDSFCFVSFLLVHFGKMFQKIGGWNVDVSGLGFFVTIYLHFVHF